MADPILILQQAFSFRSSPFYLLIAAIPIVDLLTVGRSLKMNRPTSLPAGLPSQIAQSLVDGGIGTKLFEGENLSQYFPNSQYLPIFFCPQDLEKLSFPPLKFDHLVAFSSMNKYTANGISRCGGNTYQVHNRAQAVPVKSTSDF